MKKYIPNEIEPKWQRKWEEDGIYASHLEEENKFYCLAEFAYPSGDLHMGHWFTFGGADIFARMKRMQGLNVFFPNGFDAFGLPAENAAIKKGIHPKTWTLSNIEAMRKQFSTMGASFSFDHQVITCLPEYYKWNQWIFLKMFEKGIAFRDKKLANWCPSCQTVLADEQVVDGKCDRCSIEVVQKEIPQWFLKITEYADRLLWDKDSKLDWPRAVKEGQNSWIGKKEGTVIKFSVKDSQEIIEVFTTRHDTLFGATFLVLAPEHPFAASIGKKSPEVKEYIKASQKKSQVERKENKEKTGVFTGVMAINPVNKAEIPIWIADYALMEYGTGALFGDAHDERDVEFAKKYGISLKPTLMTGDKQLDERIKNLEEVFTGDGILFDSGKFSGLSSNEARKQIAEELEKSGKGKVETVYHLRDWSVSRQRYWGTPVPIIHCNKCGLVPVAEKDLPVVLPEKVDFTPKGKAPLETAEDWINTKCPKCGGKAKRDSETLDGFFDNSWYFLRYLDPENSKEIFDAVVAKKWLPVDIYFGGAEHTLGHTMYSRFFTKFLFDLELVPVEEYAQRRVNHGIVLGSDGEKMSKSRGNVVNPDEEVKKYGADAVRVYLAFFMPYEGTGPWVSERVEGAYRFLQRVWLLAEKATDGKTNLFQMHKTIKKVTGDIENIKFNTAVAALMEWLNFLSKKTASKEEYKTFLLLLAPFAPHMTEELWSGFAGSIHQQSWPKFDNQYLEEEEVSVVVQVNGRVRDVILIQKDMEGNREVVEKMALETDKIKKFLGSQTVKKTVYVPGKIINLVV